MRAKAEAEARTRAAAEARAQAEATARAKAEAEALARASDSERADVLQRKLDEQDSAIQRREADARALAEAEAEARAEDRASLIQQHSSEMEAMRKAKKEEEERADLLQRMLDEQDEAARRQEDARKKADAAADTALRKLFRGVESLWLVCTNVQNAKGSPTDTLAPVARNSMHMHGCVDAGIARGILGTAYQLWHISYGMTLGCARA